MGAALAQAACRNGMRALCARVPRLLHELGIARADGSYTAALARLAKLDVLRGSSIREKKGMLTNPDQPTT